MGFIIALLSGALMSIQGVFNTEVTKQTSVWVAAGWVQLTAFITCLVIWLFTGREPVAGLMQVTPNMCLWAVSWEPYHLHGYPEHGKPGTGQGGSSDCGLSDNHSLCH